jgi:hypothetical protein
MVMWKTLVCGAFLVIALAALLHAEPPKKSTLSVETLAAPNATSLPTPLPAEQFEGRTREAYQAAREIPDVLAGLSCHCGCGESQGHRHLLDCFVDDHGAG